MNMNIDVRQIKREEYHLLSDFLYEAVFVPQGSEKPSKSIIQKEELQVYIKDFGSLKDDNCLVAEWGGNIAGAVWARVMNDYGHIDDETPSLAISLYEEYQGKGIGTYLMQKMLELLKEKGYKQASLSVQKENYALKMYKKIGFRAVRENAGEYIMVYTFGSHGCNL